jgi:hypothetical protein
MSTKLTEYQRRVLRQNAMADGCEVALRGWMEKVLKSPACNAVLERLNRRMDELAQPAISGTDCTDEEAVDYSIAMAAGIQFGRLAHACVFDEGDL